MTLHSQAAGALLGFGTLVLVAPEATTGAAGVALPAPGVAPAAALLVEALLTGTLALLCCALWAAADPARPDPTEPIKFGLAIVGLIYAGVSCRQPCPFVGRSFDVLIPYWRYLSMEAPGITSQGFT